ncbi:MAG: 50S ribosomal protein L11 methyltransferase [Oscillospiraceae bacterium]|jgi:ribosomal protein L11 methyltransferase|nr:50S ribosomal protein L11 methyltransferase [Oscillospiraceae bacterium]
MTRRWLEATLPATPDTLDKLTARLVGEGFESFEVIDPREFDRARPVWEIWDEDLPGRNACAVKIYLPPGDREGMGKLQSLCPELTVRERDEEDWANAWKQHYRPTPVGSRLLIQPAWLPAENPEGRAVFLNNPGMSFGTGLHVSTRLCLEILDGMDASGKRILDIGCGSGILGLCALSLGAARAVGVDIDPLAAETARENALLNGLESAYTSFAGDLLSDEGIPGIGTDYDVVFTNIIADVILPLTPLVPAYLAPGGVWIVSGVIEHRYNEVRDAAEAAGFTLLDREFRDGWTAAVFTK